MDRHLDASGAASAPAAPSNTLGANVYPQGGATPSQPGPWWWHMVTEELRAVVVAGGLTPDRGTLTQVRDAINQLVSSGATPQATTAVAGKVELADNTEAQALTDAQRALTPATLAAAFVGANASKTQNGYQILPGGMQIKFGQTPSIASNGAINVTFPTAFPTACVAVFIIADTADGGGAENNYYVSSRTATGFASVASRSNSSTFTWLALGY